MTSIARSELRSYKQLPQIWYQIQTKFRDEPRPKAGLLRVRQFLMKDSYSFDLDEPGLDASYLLHDRAYRAIFDRCGLEYVVVEADSGAMGGSQSQEFMVYTEAGEDLIASSPSGYAANLEKATSKLLPVQDLAPTGDGLPELVHTPGKASIADVTAFFGIAASQDIKCVAFMGETASHKPGDPLRPIVAFLRGDHFVNETKLNAIAGIGRPPPMLPEELELHIADPPASSAPSASRRSMTQGSLNGLNSGKPLDKLKGVLRDDPGPDEARPSFSRPSSSRTTVILDARPRPAAENIDLPAPTSSTIHLRNRLGRPRHRRNRPPKTYATSAKTSSDPLDRPALFASEKRSKIGHIFKLGTRYTESMGATRPQRAPARKPPPSWAATASVWNASSSPPSSKVSRKINRFGQPHLRSATAAIAPFTGRRHRHQRQAKRPSASKPARHVASGPRAGRPRRPPRRSRRARRCQVQRRRHHRYPLQNHHRQSALPMALLSSLDRLQQRIRRMSPYRPKSSPISPPASQPLTSAPQPPTSPSPRRNRLRGSNAWPSRCQYRSSERWRSRHRRNDPRQPRRTSLFRHPFVRLVFSSSSSSIFLVVEPSFAIYFYQHYQDRRRRPPRRWPVVCPRRPDLRRPARGPYRPVASQRTSHRSQDLRRRRLRRQLPSSAPTSLRGTDSHLHQSPARSPTTPPMVPPSSPPTGPDGGKVQSITAENGAPPCAPTSSSRKLITSPL